MCFSFFCKSTKNEQYPRTLWTKAIKKILFFFGIDVRQNIFKRDANTCQYCGSKDHLTLDHVMPKSRQGRTSWDNLTTACKYCNSKKGDLTPEEAGMHLARHPFKPSFVMFLRNFSGILDQQWIPFVGSKREPIY